MRTCMRKWLWIAMGLMLLALCLGVAVAAWEQKLAFGNYVSDPAVKDTSSISASKEGKGNFSANFLAKYMQHSEAQIPQTKGSFPSDGVNLPEHVANNTDLNAAYPLTYDANGGTVMPSSGTGISPNGTVMSQSRAGISQSHTGMSPSGTVISPNNETEISPNDANTGSGITTCSSRHDSGETVTLSTDATGDCQSSEPTRDGMQFVGWSTEKLPPFDNLSDAQAYVVGTLTMPESPKTMYAVWVKDGYTVTFKTQMDSEGIAAAGTILKQETVAAGGIVTPPDQPASYNKGIQFMGWGVSIDGGDASGEGIMTPFDATAPVTASVTVWPLWGYEDNSAGHRCVMSVDTVATCFPDPVLAQTVVDAAQATDAHQTSDIWTLRDALFFGRLNCNSDGDTGDNRLNISELDGLQTLTGLGQLHISNVEGNTLNEHSRDLHQLKYLDKMENLFANGDGITEVSNLSGMKYLQTLYLNDNNISDLSGLSRLWDLQTLKLNNNSISDLSGLVVSPTEHLSRITELDLNHNAIVHVSSLAPLTTLNTLQLQSNQIESIDSLAALQGMYALYLDNNQIEDIGVIKNANFQYLTMLGLSSNKIRDISSLRDVTTLKQLWLHYNDISDVSPLAGLTNLTTLYIGSNHIRDISSLKNLTKLNGGTNNSCDVGNSSFCADNQSVTLTDTLTADPGLSMPTAVTLKKAADGSVAAAAVDSSASTSPVSPSAPQFDAEHWQLTWEGPMQYNNDNSPKSLTQTFDADAQLPNTVGNFSGTITELYTVAKHTVTIEPGEGTLPSEQPSSLEVRSGYKVTAPVSEPSRDGYRFVGWICAADVAGVCHAGDSFDFANTAVTRDVTLAAKWQELAVALPFTGASNKDYWWRGGIAVIVLGLALASELLRRHAVDD